MSERKPLVVGNWKSNGRQESASALLSGLVNRLDSSLPVDVAVCPPFPYLALSAMLLDGSRIGLGAQNLSMHGEGAYTGEVTGAMLADVGCRHVLVGHSERRALMGETDEVVAMKFRLALQAGLVPILCVGETLEERESDRTEAVIASQVRAVVPAMAGLEASRFIVAYEPVWAIGTGRSASPEQAQAVHAFIRGCLEAAGAPAAGVRLLYGGSVKASNAASLFSMPDIDGGLIGGASLVVDEFMAIVDAAAVQVVPDPSKQ